MEMYSKPYIEMPRTASFLKTGSSFYLKKIKINAIILVIIQYWLKPMFFFERRDAEMQRSVFSLATANAKQLLILFLFSLFFSFSTKAQSTDTTFQTIDSLPIQATFLTTDALHQIYIATEEGEILKLAKDGEKLFEYNNRRLGRVSSIDATNPFNILVYYGDLATVVLLDRTLSPLKEINLFDLNIFEAQAVGLSNDNHIWIYDPIAAQLKKINKAGDILFQSRHLKQVIKSTLNVSSLLERNNQLYLNDPSKGIFVFDTFGQLQQQVPIIEVQHFQLLQGQFIYLKDGFIQYYNLETGETKTSNDPYTAEATMIRFIPQQVIIAQKNKLVIISK